MNFNMATEDRPEIKDSAGHRGNLPCGYELVRDWSEPIGRHPHHVIIQTWTIILQNSEKPAEM